VSHRHFGGRPRRHSRRSLQCTPTARPSEPSLASKSPTMPCRE
jgi:hypothetical protein